MSSKKVTLPSADDIQIEDGEADPVETRTHRTSRRRQPVLDAISGGSSPLSFTEQLEKENRELNERLKQKQSNSSAALVVKMPVTGTAIEFELIEIDPELIDLSPENGRIQKFLDEMSTKDILPSIKAVGQHTPGTVRRLENGRYELIAGSRRLWATRVAGQNFKAYSAVVPDEDVRELSKLENKRQDLSFYEEAMAYASLVKSGEFASWNKLSEEFGISQSNISRYKQLAELEEVFVRILTSPSDMHLTYGQTIAALKKKDPKKLADKASQLLDLRREALEQGRAGLGIEEIIKELKAAVRSEEKSSGLIKPRRFASKNGERSLAQSTSADGACRLQLDGFAEEEIEMIVQLVRKELELQEVDS